MGKERVKAREMGRHYIKEARRTSKNLPFVVYGFDNETQCGRDGVDVLSHDPLHNRRFAGIIETPFP